MRQGEIHKEEDRKKKKGRYVKSFNAACVESRKAEQS